MCYRTVLECRRTFSNEDIESFVTTTGDSNPIHTDCKAAKASGKAPVHVGILQDWSSFVTALIIVRIVRHGGIN